VQAGDTIFVPAGTVHALGAGLTVCEIQENSDVTYRLYDYGRPRELHLDHGAAVADTGPREALVERVPLGSGREQLVACPYFRMERLEVKERAQIAGLPYYLLLLCVKGSGEIGGQPFRAGQAWMTPAGAGAIALDGPESEWILAYTADEPLRVLNASGARETGA
ncbi:MAG: hypothetical protein JO211_15125, partial [Acidobacteriaceae bacterium]|nr:hypothetical protein [Acidobacteriaceae bacterium]